MSLFGDDEDSHGNSPFFDYNNEIWDSLLEDEISYDESEEHEELFQKWTENLYDKNYTSSKATAIISRAFRLYLKER